MGDDCLAHSDRFFHADVRVTCTACWIYQLTPSPMQIQISIQVGSLLERVLFCQLYFVDHISVLLFVLFSRLYEERTDHFGIPSFVNSTLDPHNRSAVGRDVRTWIHQMSNTKL